MLAQFGKFKTGKSKDRKRKKTNEKGKKKKKKKKTRKETPEKRTNLNRKKSTVRNCRDMSRSAKLAPEANR